MLLSAIFKPKQTQKQKTQEAYAQYAGTRMASPGNYTSSRGPIGTAVSDVAMGLGYQTKDASYYARTERTKARRAVSNRTEYGNDDSPARAAPKPRQPTAAELKAQRKAAELAERKRLGQIARKKFEKEKGERVAALRKKIATLLNVS